jgi:hypothetical protein
MARGRFASLPRVKPRLPEGLPAPGQRTPGVEKQGQKSGPSARRGRKKACSIPENTPRDTSSPYHPDPSRGLLVLAPCEKIRRLPGFIGPVPPPLSIRVPIVKVQLFQCKLYSSLRLSARRYFEKCGRTAARRKRPGQVAGPLANLFFLVPAP